MIIAKAGSSLAWAATLLFFKALALAETLVQHGPAPNQRTPFKFLLPALVGLDGKFQSVVAH